MILGGGSFVVMRFPLLNAPKSMESPRAADGRRPGIFSVAWFDAAAFDEPNPYQFGSAGRNIVTGPGVYNWTFGLFRNIDLQEKQRRIQLRIETFKFNKVNLSNPDTNFDSTTFGQILAASPARQVQFGLKYLF